MDKGNELACLVPENICHSKVNSSATQRVKNSDTNSQKSTALPTKELQILTPIHKNQRLCPPPPKELKLLTPIHKNQHLCPK